MSCAGTSRFQPRLSRNIACEFTSTPPDHEIQTYTVADKATEMSEYWKSTPKYWCKHCRTYVRDTPLEKANHEATLTHQNAVKRALRDIHRGHEREEREKDRAKAEIERLNRLVPGSSVTAKGTTSTPTGLPTAREVKGAEVDRKRQMEELAGLGVSIPTDFRGDMAMPGEWTVTATRVIEEKTEEEVIAAKATGVRKREQSEVEKEEEEAMKGLFKKPKKWGRGFKTMPDDGDKELDALLSGDLSKVEKAEKDEKTEPEDDKVKKEGEDVKREDGAEDSKDKVTLKAEPGEDGVEAGGLSPKLNLADIPAAPVFKKRKAKNIRQK